MKWLLSLLFEYIYQKFTKNMRLSFLILVFVFSFWNAQAQFEASKRKVNISAQPQKAPQKKALVPQNNPISIAPSLKFESHYFSEPKSKFLEGLPELPKVGQTQTPKSYPLKTPAEDYTEKFNQQMKEDGIRPELFNRDMNLGQFVVYTKNINLNSRDYGAIDGDLVRLWVNGVVITDRIYLESQFKQIQLTLEKGVNVIEIEALNYGELSPNTGQFTFYDANNQFITNQYWNLGIGYKARILIEYQDKILKKADEK
ncbi:hypothetical protein CLV55_101290 [Flavobacterium aciduliphilum]|uniref:Uncharacterized protein n=2 Tax=Flavobacterium aciduliphilum TaxID=1101402 RepID=A0A328YPR1_9FLAO|nr:hypothetical protein CLV55_101290 [Flavobacterium aciduliphilum]